jgi:hypothetical protein
LLAFVKGAHHRAMHHQPYKQLETFDEVVEKLGGAGKVGALCQGQDAAAVCNWKRRRGCFPAKYYPVMIDELNARHADAPRELWGFYKRENSEQTVDAA